MTTNEYDFTNEQDLAPDSWENINADQVKSTLNDLARRIETVAGLLEKMVVNNDYDKTSKEFDKLWMNDLGAGGFVTSFYNTNTSTFSEFRNAGMAPPWYSTLTPEKKKAFDTAQQYFIDAHWFVKPMEEIREIMMLLPIKNAFRFMRLTLNLDELGFSEELYHKINQDVLDVTSITNKSWVVLESHAYQATRYYQQNGGTMSRDRLNEGYRQARMKDHQLEVDSYRLKDRFIAHSNGTYTVEPGFLADMKVLDKYTEQIALLDNIEEGMKDTLSRCPRVIETLNEVRKNVQTGNFLVVADALIVLNRALIDYCEGGLNVWTCYKNRDTDAPYCFIRKLPAYSNMTGYYGFSPITSDPWLDGTRFYDLYLCAAKALSSHCKDFMRRGHSELL